MMSEVRCPMCSKPNSDEDEICAFCGARLKPLIVDQPPQDSPSEYDESRLPGEETGDDDVPDWLDRIRSEPDRESVDEATEDAGLPDRSDDPDWLGRLRHVETDDDEGPPEGEIPDWLSDELEEGDRIEEPQEPAEAGDEEAGVPDWLSRIREREEQEREGPPEPVEEGWLDRLRDDDVTELPTPEEIAPDLEVPSEEEPGIDLEAILAPDEETFPPKPPLAMESVEDIPEPEDLSKPEDMDEADAAWEEPPELSLEETPLEEEIAIPTPLDIEEEDFAIAPPEDEGAKIIPEDFTAEGEEAELPHVPALVFDEDVQPVDGEPRDVDLDAIELPDWLTEISEPSIEEETPEEVASPDLAPATLPSWLEAMRPIETFRSVVEIESAEDQVVESAGPLAGLRGVLMAEPIMAMPRTASVGAARLDVTERQYAQAELLQRMVEDEAYEEPKVSARRARLPITRWLISLVLIVAVALPSFLSLGIGEVFPLPILVPRELSPLYLLIEGMSPEKPVLIVFDYTPGYTGELAVVAGVLFEHMMARDLKVASLSTWPTGPPLAEGLLRDYGENGVNYVHLGYLSGGPTAVQLFAAAPREAVPKGFMLPEELESQSGWESAVLNGVSRLSDFGMVAVITAGTESARTWAEQAHPYLGETPLVMILSAGAEPLVRPYYEALEPQVDGILTGLPAAVAYEKMIGLADNAQGRWTSFGMGVVAIELILIAGGLYGVAVWLLRLRGE